MAISITQYGPPQKLGVRLKRQSIDFNPRYPILLLIPVGTKIGYTAKGAFDEPYFSLIVEASITGDDRKLLKFWQGTSDFAIADSIATLKEPLEINLEKCNVEILSDDQLVYKIRMYYNTKNVSILERVDESQNSTAQNLDSLIEKGVDLDVKDERGQTALYRAVLNGNYNLAKNLVETRVDLNAKTNEGGSALIWASFKNYYDIANLLISNDADLNIKNNVGNTPLMLASLSNNLKIIQLLKGNGADLNAKDNDGNTALHYCADKGHLEAVQLLIEEGAQMNVINETGEIELVFASPYKHPSIGHHLSIKGADINVKNNKGETALHLAANKYHTQIVQLLEKVGAK